STDHPARRDTPGKLSFRFGVRRHRLHDERPPAVSQHANIGQNLLSLFLGHFALRVRQLIEALLDLRPKLSAADFAVVLQGRLPGEARAFELRRNQIARDNDCSRDQNNNDAHLQRELRETLGGRGGDRVGNSNRGQMFDFAGGDQIFEKRRFFALQSVERAVDIARRRVEAELRYRRDYFVVLAANGNFEFVKLVHGSPLHGGGVLSNSPASVLRLSAVWVIAGVTILGIPLSFFATHRSTRNSHIIPDHAHVYARTLLAKTGSAWPKPVEQASSRGRLRLAFLQCGGRLLCASAQTRHAARMRPRDRPRRISGGSV